jgi:Zn ribbon nucleic-acid-binding protein
MGKIAETVEKIRKLQDELTHTENDVRFDIGYRYQCPACGGKLKVYESDNFGYVECDECGTFKIKVEHEKSRSLVLDSLYYKTQQYAHKRTKEDYRKECRGCPYYHNDTLYKENIGLIDPSRFEWVPPRNYEYCSFFREAYLTPEGYPSHGINNLNPKLLHYNVFHGSCDRCPKDVGDLDKALEIFQKPMEEE